MSKNGKWGENLEIGRAGAGGSGGHGSGSGFRTGNTGGWADSLPSVGSGSAKVKTPKPGAKKLHKGSAPKGAHN